MFTVIMNVNIFIADKDQWKLIAFRVLLSSHGVIFYYALRYSDEGVCTIINNLCPIIVLFPCKYFLLEKFGKRSTTLDILSFAGVIVIGLCLIRSDIDYKLSESTIGCILALISVTCFSFGLIVIRLMNQSLNVLFAPFYSAASGFVFVFPLVLMKHDLVNLDRYNNVDIKLMMLAAFFDSISELLKSNALKYECVSRFAPFTYLFLVMQLYVDIFGFN